MRLMDAAARTAPHPHNSETGLSVEPKDRPQGHMRARASATATDAALTATAPRSTASRAQPLGTVAARLNGPPRQGLSGLASAACGYGLPLRPPPDTKAH